jgi:hypothetical protein
MGLDVDYIAAKDAIEELEKFLSNQPHGEREAIADDIILLVAKLKAKYDKKAKPKLENWNPDWPYESDDPRRWDGW